MTSPAPFSFITYNLTLITRKPYTLLTNPTTHYNGNDNGRVITNNPNTWIPYSNNIPKSIYDPCPYGYRVPADGSWNGFPKNTWTAYAITGGTSWNSSWWPAAGHRNYGNTILYSIGDRGWYWSSSRHPSYAYYAYDLYFNYDVNVYPSNNDYRSFGLATRCIEEK